MSTRVGVNKIMVTTKEEEFWLETFIEDMERLDLQNYRSIFCQLIELEKKL